MWTNLWCLNIRIMPESTFSYVKSYCNACILQVEEHPRISQHTCRSINKLSSFINGYIWIFHCCIMKDLVSLFLHNIWPQFGDISNSSSSCQEPLCELLIKFIYQYTPKTKGCQGLWPEAHIKIDLATFFKNLFKSVSIGDSKDQVLLLSHLV